MFPYGQTGMASMGDGSFYFSEHGEDKENKLQYTHIYKYRIDTDSEDVFIK